MAIGAMLGALVSGLGIAAEAGAQGAQTNLGYQNLFETKRVNRKKEQLATADKVDARGNRLFYDPTFGWQIDLDPETKKILEAEDLETLLSLTEDATRNRDAAVRQDDRSKMAGDEFEKIFNEYKFRTPKSEAEYIGDAQREKLQARRKGSDEAAAGVNRALLRQGNSSNIPAVFKASRDAEAAEFEDALLGGKRQGMQDFLQFEGGKDAKAQSELQFLQGLAESVTALPQRFTNRANELSSGASSALTELLQTISSNEGSRQSATSTLMQALGQSPNFSPLASSLGRLNFEGSGEATGPVAAQRDIPYPRPREEGMRARLRAGF